MTKKERDNVKYIILNFSIETWIYKENERNKMQ